MVDEKKILILLHDALQPLFISCDCSIKLITCHLDVSSLFEACARKQTREQGHRRGHRERTGWIHILGHERGRRSNRQTVENRPVFDGGEQVVGLSSGQLGGIFVIY